jgi:hypothetical protein
MYSISDFLKAFFVILTCRDNLKEYLYYQNEVMLVKHGISLSDLEAMFNLFDDVVFAERERAIVNQDHTQVQYLDNLIETCVPTNVRIQRDFKSLLLTSIRSQEFDFNP